MDWYYVIQNLSILFPVLLFILYTPKFIEYSYADYTWFPWNLLGPSKESGPKCYHTILLCVGIQTDEELLSCSFSLTLSLPHSLSPSLSLPLSFHLSLLSPSLSLSLPLSLPCPLMPLLSIYVPSTCLRLLTQWHWQVIEEYIYPCISIWL